MAVNSGSFRTANSGYAIKYGLFEWQRTEYSKEDNFSLINWTLKGDGGSGSSSYTYCYGGTVIVDGQEVIIPSGIRVNNGTILASGTKIIKHNDDGSKSFSASASIKWYSSGATPKTGSGTWELPKIDRYPIMTINSSTKYLNSISLNLGYSQATPTNIQVLIDSTVVYEGTSTTPIINGLEPNTKYEFKARGYANGGWGDYSTIVSITTLNKATIISADNFTDEGMPSISFVNSSGNQTNAVLKVENVEIVRMTDITSPCNFSLTTSQRNQLRNLSANVSNLTVTYVIETVGTKIYVASINKTMTVINANPIFNDFTYKDINSKTTKITGNNQILIKGKSDIEFTIPIMIPQKNAVGKTYNCFSGKSYITVEYTNKIQIAVLNEAISGELHVQATDSRGNSTIVDKTVHLVEYSKPIIGSFTVSRVNGVNEETFVNANGTYTTFEGLTENNAITSAKYRYRIGKETWSNYISILNSNIIFNAGNWSITNIGIDGDTVNGFNIENTYEIELVISDKLDNNLSNATLNSAKPLLWKDKLNKFLGIGKKPTKTLDVAGEILAESNITTQGEFIMKSGNVVLDYVVIDEWEE